MANRSRFGGENRLKAMHEANYPGGLLVDPMPITAGEEVTVFYNGLLGPDGLGQVYLHYGFGDHEQWRGVYDQRMEKTGWGWITSVVMPNQEERFNICFKDGADHWDNNNSINWSFQIHNGSPN